MFAGVCIRLHRVLKPTSYGVLRFYYVSAGATVVKVPRDKLLVNFSRSSGAGGQNVNKLNTKAEVRFHVEDADWLDEHVKSRIAELHKGMMTKEGHLVITSQKHRTQHANLEDAMEKLEQMLLQAAEIPKVRELKTEPSVHAKDAWKEEKRRRSEVKARRKGGWDD